jgi:hypothetical protein
LIIPKNWTRRHVPRDKNPLASIPGIFSLQPVTATPMEQSDALLGSRRSFFAGGLPSMAQQKQYRERAAVQVRTFSSRFLRVKVIPALTRP